MATIRIERDTRPATAQARARFLKAWHTGKYQGVAFSFESPAALFRVLTPKRWEMLETLQARGTLGLSGRYFSAPALGLARLGSAGH